MCEIRNPENRLVYRVNKRTRTVEGRINAKLAKGQERSKIQDF
jgi:hypothetical protein